MAEVDSIAGVFSNINLFQVFSFEGRLKHCELHLKSWTLPPPTHKVQFFYEQIYITLQI